MEKYGLRLITKKNKISGDNFVILQYKLDCMKKITIRKVLKWAVIISSLLGLGEISKPLQVASDIITVVNGNDTIK